VVADLVLLGFRNALLLDLPIPDVHVYVFLYDPIMVWAYTLNTMILFGMDHGIGNVVGIRMW